MKDHYDILAKLHEHRPNIETALGADRFDEFEARRAALGRRSVEEDEDPARAAELTAHILALIRDYPEVGDLLRDREPGLLPSPRPALPQNPAGAPAADPPLSPRPASREKQTRASGASTANPPPDTRPRSAVPAPESHIPAPPPMSGQPRWTPELVIQAFKEATTAVIGMLLIGFTVYLAVRAVDVAGDTAKTADTRQVLTLLIGLAGVVLGYYFGRIPAEGQATAARNDASRTAAGAHAITLKAEALTTEVDRVYSDPAVTRGGTLSAEHMDAVRRLRDDLRATMHSVPRP